MKRGIFIFLILLLAGSLAVCAGAEQVLARVEDGAGLMTNQEALELEEALQAVTLEYELHIAIVTTDSLGLKSPRAYADDYYDALYGAGSDGILFLLSMEERDWYISTSGRGMELLSDGEVYDSVDEILYYLSDAEYYAGFAQWVESLPWYLDNEEAEHPDYEYDTDTSPSIWISLAIGAGVALVVILIMRSSMNTKRQQPSARHYLVGGSYHLRTQQDIFLYSNVTKTAKPKDNGGGSGGGRSHGGGGGKF